MLISRGLRGAVGKCSRDGMLRAGEERRRPGRGRRGCGQGRPCVVCSAHGARSGRRDFDGPVCGLRLRPGHLEDASNAPCRHGRVLGTEGSKTVGHFADTAKPLLAVLLEGFLDDVLEPRGKIRSQLAKIARHARENLRAYLGERISVEGRSSRKGLVKHHAERPEVGASVHAARRHHLLWGHVKGDPMVAVVLVTAPPPVTAPPLTFEMPKSRTLTESWASGRRMTNKLAGFRSR